MMMGGIGMILWLVVIVAVVYFLVQNLNRTAPPSTGSRPPARQEDPLEILKARYARGEITREEFEQMKRDLLT